MPPNRDILRRQNEQLGDFEFETAVANEMKFPYGRSEIDASRTQIDYGKSNVPRSAAYYYPLRDKVTLNTQTSEGQDVRSQSLSTETQAHEFRHRADTKTGKFPDLSEQEGPNHQQVRMFSLYDNPTDVNRLFAITDGLKASRGLTADQSLSRGLTEMIKFKPQVIEQTAKYSFANKMQIPGSDQSFGAHKAYYAAKADKAITTAHDVVRARRELEAKNILRRAATKRDRSYMYNKDVIAQRLWELDNRVYGRPYTGLNRGPIAQGVSREPPPPDKFGPAPKDWRR
jgi:hypothetical protein